MQSKSAHQAGFAAILLIIGVVVVASAIGFVGYRAYQQHSKTVSYSGTFQQQSCTGANPGCTGYTLAATNAKNYNLALTPTTPPVASGTKVAVTGTASNSSSGSTITVTKIVPMAAAPTPPSVPAPATPPAFDPNSPDAQVINGTAYLSPNGDEGMSVQYTDVEGGTTYHPFEPLQQGITANTSIINKAGSAIKLSDIVAGDSLQVKQIKNPSVSAASGSSGGSNIKIYSIQDLSR